MSLFKDVNVVSINVKDWEAAKKFYRETLGWPVAFSDDQAGWEEYGRDNEAHVSISRWMGPEPMPPQNGGTTLVLSVEDAHAVAAALKAKGVKCDDVMVIPGMVTYGSFYDPEGNRIQFASMVPPPAA
ncbi:MAG: VOC family protein [Acidobacteriia bacterium]|nr:VOC family protein [Terriglobia bacterium]